MDEIKVSCTSCKHTMRFSQDKAGRKTKCPKCGSVVVIEAAEANGVAAAPPKPEEDDLGAYGAADIITDEDKARKEEEGKKKKKKKKEKKSAKIQKKVRAIPDAEDWDKVRSGLMFVFIGTCLWAGAHLLQGIYVALGMVDYTELTRGIVEELNARQGQPLPAEPGFWDIDQLGMLLRMIAGNQFLGLAKGCLILGAILRLCQPIVSAVGYIICLPVPNRFGTIAQLTTLLSLGGWNTLAVLGLMVLPAVGAYQYYLVPLLTPEVVLTEYNIERSLPLNVLWMSYPFFESLLNIVVQFLYYLEPVVGAVFLWSVGLAIKEPKVEESAQTLVNMGLGTFFLLVAFHMLSVTGTTPVLVLVLRVLYCLWYAFLLLFILSYASLLLKTRDLLYAKIHPENELIEEE